MSEAKQLDSPVCDLMQQDNSSRNAWVQGTAQANPPQYTKQGQVWSFFKYRNSCSEIATSVEFTYVPIEPAVGLLRHPFAHPCGAGNAALEVEDRGYEHSPPTFEYMNG